MIRTLIAVLLTSVAASPAHAVVPRFDHVFVIVGENTSYDQLTAARAPYFTRTLRPAGASLTNYRALGDSKSLGNYIAMFSGQYTRCEANDANPDSCHQGVDNLFSQLARTGRTWRVWAESMPDACHRSDAGGEYAAHHNPALYFTRLHATCASSDLPMGALDGALARGEVGDLNVVVPNNCENGHDPCGGDGVRHFDAFLSRVVPRIERSPGFGSRDVIFVVWDEGGHPPHDHTHVAAAAVGPLVRRGAVDRSRHDHFGLERTLALGFGVTPLARAHSAAAITSIWRR